MKIVKQPDDFTPAFGQVVYGLSEAVSQVTVWDDVMEAPLGIKRCPDPASVNIASYLRRRFSPHPVAAGRCGLSVSAGRTVTSSIEVGGVRSAGRLFTCGLVVPPSSGLLTSFPTYGRKLREGEHDEVSIAVRGESLKCRLTVRGDKTFTISVADLPAFTGIGILVVDASHIAAQAQANGIEYCRCTKALAEIWLGERYVTTLEYDLLPAFPGSLRLCWLNRFGGIDFHTFSVPAAEKMVASKTRMIGRNGLETVSSRSERTFDLTTDFFPRRIMEPLSEVVSSPAVWISRSGGFSDVDVVSSEMSVSGVSLCRAEISVRERGFGTWKNIWS